MTSAGGSHRAILSITTPETGGRARQAQAAIDARKARNLTATKDADGNMVLTLEDGTTVTLPSA